MPQAATPSVKLEPPTTAGTGGYDPPLENHLEKQMMDLGIDPGERVEDRNKAIALRMVALVNAGDLDGYVSYLAETVINHGFSLRREDVRAVLQDIKDTFPDIRFEPTRVLAEGEWVTIRMWFCGTHQGVSRFPVNSGILLGLPPTGLACRVEHIHLFRIREGVVHEHYACRDDVHMARQLGALPSLPPMPGMPPLPATQHAEEREVSLAG